MHLCKEKIGIGVGLKSKGKWGNTTQRQPSVRTFEFHRNPGQLSRSNLKWCKTRVKKARDSIETLLVRTGRMGGDFSKPGPLLRSISSAAGRSMPATSPKSLLMTRTDVREPVLSRIVSAIRRRRTVAQVSGSLVRSAGYIESMRAALSYCSLRGALLSPLSSLRSLLSPLGPLVLCGSVYRARQQQE